MARASRRRHRLLPTCLPPARWPLSPSDAAGANMRALQTPQSILSIYVASAPANDEESVMYLCACLPAPAYLRAIVEHPAPARGEETVRFVRCVGRELCVFWLPDVTDEEAAAIAAACEPIGRWSVEAFTAAVGRALGATVRRLQ